MDRQRAEKLKKIGAFTFRYVFFWIEAGESISFINMDYVLHKLSVLLCNTMMLLFMWKWLLSDSGFVTYFFPFFISIFVFRTLRKQRKCKGDFCNGYKKI